MKDSGDILHANSVQVLDGHLAARHPAFREGNLLVSIHALGIVAVLDPGSGKMISALYSGQWRAQHTPRLLDSGTLLLFDNAGSLSWGAADSRGGPGDAADRLALRRGGVGAILVRHARRRAAATRTATHCVVGLEQWPRVRGDAREGNRLGVRSTLTALGAKKDLVATLSQVERLDRRMPTDWARVPAAASP